MNLDPFFDQASPPAAATAKRERHRLARREGGSFVGTNTAPGLRDAKGSACGRRPSRTPSAVAVGQSEIVVFRGDEVLPWSMGEVTS